jgi:hypothetical protein
VAVWAARSARSSAAEARRVREQGGERLQVKRQARHDALAPTHPGVIDAYVKTSPIGGESLYGTPVFPRHYRVRGVANVGNGFTPVGGLPLLVHAHHPYDVHIEPAYTGRASLLSANLSP